ncbi:DDE superfamily endonuclease [Trichonephila clavipes]|nr:DDE superfamily endonuclease [Trichonephila clavipes]
MVPGLEPTIRQKQRRSRVRSHDNTVIAALIKSEIKPTVARSAPLSSSYIRFVGGVGVPRGVKGCRGDVQDKTAKYFKGVGVHCTWLSNPQKEADLQLCCGKSYSLYTKGLQSCQVIYSQFGFVIHQNDHQARRRFREWAQNEIAVVPDFHKLILFSDEAHFWLNGYVNKQNCRIWSEANPQAYVETPLHTEKLTVWCALWAGGILLQKR